MIIVVSESDSCRPVRRWSRAQVGRCGEDLAADYLLGLGWQVIERNWRCRRGELDVIATDGQRLIVIEVKTRTGELWGTPTESVTPVKLARMRTLTRLWLAQNPGRYWSSIRFDVIGVLLAPGAQPQIRHLPGVF